MRPHLRPIPGVLVLAVLLTGCVGDDGTTPIHSPPSDEIRIGLTEWTIENGGAPAAPGDVRLLVTNTGATRHDLVVTGRHGTWATPYLNPGEQHELHIRVARGEDLALTCSLTGHHAQGMHASLPAAETK
jgi:hypothetical protein